MRSGPHGSQNGSGAVEGPRHRPQHRFLSGAPRRTASAGGRRQFTPARASAAFCSVSELDAGTGARRRWREGRWIARRTRLVGATRTLSRGVGAAARRHRWRRSAPEPGQVRTRHVRGPGGCVLRRTPVAGRRAHCSGARVHVVGVRGGPRREGPLGLLRCLPNHHNVHQRRTSGLEYCYLRRMSLVLVDCRGLKTRSLVWLCQGD